MGVADISGDHERHQICEPAAPRLEAVFALFPDGYLSSHFPTSLRLHAHIGYLPPAAELARARRIGFKPSEALMTLRGLGDPAARGTAMVLVATLAWSFAGLFTRSLSLDVWTTVSLRSLAAASMLLVIQCFKHRTATLHNLLGIGFVGWAAVLLSVVAQAATTASFFLTSVAHVTVLYATCPFVAAIIARVWLQERVSKTTLIAVVASIVGVVIVVSGSSETSTLSGDFVALLMTLSFSTTMVLSKARPTLKILEATTLGAILTFAIFLPFVSTDKMDPLNLTLVSVYGFSNMVLAFFLFIAGARHLPAATSGLILTLEIILSPLWVWLAFDESVDDRTLFGGGIVASAVVGHLLISHARWPRFLAESLGRAMRN